MKYLLLIVLSLFFYNFNVYAAKPQSPGKSNKQESVQHDAKADHTDSDAVKSKEKQNKDKKEKAAKPSDEDDREDKAADEDRAKNANKNVPNIAANGGNSGAKKNRPAGKTSSPESTLLGINRTIDVHPLQIKNRATHFQRGFNHKGHHIFHTCEMKCDNC